jgi:hypothetical protein
MGGRDRRLFLALLLASAGVQCHAILGPSPVDTNWRVVDSPHFSFNVRPGSLAEQNIARIGEVLEDQYATTLRSLDIRYSGRISMFLYTSAADGDMESDRSGTAYPDTEAVSATTGPPLDGNLFLLLSHESNHVIQQNALGKPGTYFLSEGLPSTALSERFYPIGATMLYGWTATHLAQIPALSLIVDDDKWNTYDQQVVYNASASFLTYLLEGRGPQLLKQLQPVTSTDFVRRFQEIYGQSLDDAERDWRVFCASRAR